jgi:hypothetical protein
LSQHVDLQGVESLQCREDGSATLMIHEPMIETLLCARGRDSMFVKIHQTDESRFPTELLWLPESPRFKQRWI